ncbi:hypothetical protein [Arthrobacter sp. 35W]|uniref:hypothetical protein n=1 Tax=Arthrobacter sp. 35W TaxID=1132441 RepID=UPI00041F15FE|nr:hypothetical protein [Arthrobacter sp. 35W]
MVAHLLRLKLDLLRNSLKRSTMAVVGLVIGGLYGLGMLVLVLVGLVLLGSADLEIASTVIVLAGSAVILGWLVIPVLAAGVDMTLDPARFTTFAIPMRTLLTGLALSGLIGIPGAITALAALGTVGTWWRHPLAAVAAVVCAALAVMTCIVASRAMTAASSNLAASRRFKDVSGLVLLIPLMLLGPIIAGTSDVLRNFAEVLPALARTLSWTPLGAAWSVPADLAGGHYGAAGLKFLIAVGTLAGLLWLWKIFLARALVTPAHSGGARKTAGNIGFFRWFPATPTGAVAARSLTYWFRDPRYAAGLVISPLLPLVFVLVGVQSGSMFMLLFAGAIATYLMCWFISTDISYDNTAFALHVATGVSGAADRMGRALACAVIAVPLGIVYTVVGAALNDAWAYLPGTLGLTLALVGASLGLASVFSARFTYNVPAPGESPLKSKPGNSFSSVLVQMAGVTGVAVMVLPVAVLSIVGVLAQQAHLSWIALAVALVLGTLFLVLGIRWGGRIYDKRAPELLLAVSKDS